MLRVALTGGIASGKSTVADAFRELRVPVIDTDRIARDVVEPGRPGLARLVDAFGRGILDRNGKLDRAGLRERIFSDGAARRQVDALLHPVILEQLRDELAHVRAPYAVVEVPLLAETRIADMFDRVLVIDVPEHIQLQRLQARDHVSVETARQALEAQATRAERLRLADDVLRNDGDLDELHGAVERLHRRYLELAAAFASRDGGPQNNAP